MIASGLVWDVARDGVAQGEVGPTSPGNRKMGGGLGGGNVGAGDNDELVLNHEAGHAFDRPHWGDNLYEGGELKRCIESIPTPGNTAMAEVFLIVEVSMTSTAVLPIRCV